MPEWKEEIRKRLVDLKLPPAREAEIQEELAQHLEERYRSYWRTALPNGPPIRRRSENSTTTAF